MPPPSGPAPPVAGGCAGCVRALYAAGAPDGKGRCHGRDGPGAEVAAAGRACVRRQGFPAFSARRGLVAAPGRCKGSKPVRGPGSALGGVEWRARARRALPRSPARGAGLGPRRRLMPMHSCTNAQKYRYGFIAMRLYAVTPVCRCADAPMFRYAHAPMHRHLDASVAQYLAIALLRGAKVTVRR